MIGLTHCPHLPDLLSDRQERDFDSSVTIKMCTDNRGNFNLLYYLYSELPLFVPFLESYYLKNKNKQLYSLYSQEKQDDIYLHEGSNYTFIVACMEYGDFRFEIKKCCLIRH